MSSTKLNKIVRESIGNIWRELRITLTPVPRPEKWVFLVGCYNSGTTLLADLLGAHDSISALPTEGHFITDQFIKDFDVGLPRMWVANEKLFRLTEQDGGPDANRIKREWGMRLDLSKPVLLEKSPPNTAKMRWLQKHFENAYFIGIIRNGYAVAEGIRRKGDPKHLPEGWPIEDSINQWKMSNQIMIEDAKKLANYHQISYEDLTANPETTLNEIAGFLSIPAFDASLHDEAHKIHERNEPVRNLNQHSIDRLSAEEITQINLLAGDYLQELGYELITLG